MLALVLALSSTPAHAEVPDLSLSPTQRVEALERYQRGRDRLRWGMRTLGFGFAAQIGGLALLVNDPSDPLGLGLYAGGLIAAGVVAPVSVVHGAANTTVGAAPFIGARGTGAIAASVVGVGILWAGAGAFTTDPLLGFAINVVGYGLTFGATAVQVQTIRRAMDDVMGGDQEAAWMDTAPELRFAGVVPVRRGLAVAWTF